MSVISLNPSSGPNTITAIDFGVSNPKLSGTIDVSLYTSASSITCAANSVSSIKLYTGSNNVLSVLSIIGNNLSSYPDLSNCNKLTSLVIGSNITPFTDQIPQVNNHPLLVSYKVYTNGYGGCIPQLSGSSTLSYFEVPNLSLTGSIPSLQYCSGSLINLYVQNNNLTGTIPDSISGCTKLVTFLADSNNLTGNIPNLSSLNRLSNINVSSNNLGGTIPDLISCTSLRSFSVRSNNFTTFSGSFPTTLTSNLQFNDNFLTQTSVDNILSASVVANGVSGSLNVAGSNSAPSATGLTYKSTLISRNWTVTTN